MMMIFSWSGFDALVNWEDSAVLYQDSLKMFLKITWVLLMRTTMMLFFKMKMRV